MTALGDIMKYSDAYIVTMTAVNADGPRGDGVSNTRASVVHWGFTEMMNCSQ